jgi:hypothetical protein
MARKGTEYEDSPGRLRAVCPDEKVGGFLENGQIRLNSAGVNRCNMVSGREVD